MVNSLQRSWKIVLIIALIGIISSCTISDQTSSNKAFDKRLYTKGYHFKGFDFKKNKLQPIEGEKELKVAEFQSKPEKIEPINKNETPPVKLEKPQKTIQEKNQFSRDRIERTGSKLQPVKRSFIKRQFKTEFESYDKEKRKKDIDATSRNYLISAILGGIGLFFFWTGILFIGFGILALIFATIAMTKDRQLIKEGVTADKRSLEKIEKLVPAIPTIVIFSLLAIIVGVILALIGAFGLEIALIALAGIGVVALGLIGLLVAFALGIVLLINLIRKVVEYKNIQENQ